jgi:hypothetical protein
MELFIGRAKRLALARIAARTDEIRFPAERNALPINGGNFRWAAALAGCKNLNVIAVSLDVLEREAA